MPQDLTEEIDSTGMSDDMLNSMFPELEEAQAAISPQPVVKVSQPLVNGRAFSRTGADISRMMFFDIETIPDEDRVALFELPPIEAPPPETACDKCPEPKELLALSLEKMVGELLRINPDDEYLALLQTTENQVSKPREGVGKNIKKVVDARIVLDDRIKKLSVTPEYCRIVALGWAVGAEAPKSVLAGSADAERTLLTMFWKLAEQYSPLCGFNVCSFDLVTIMVRSGILGVLPSRMVNLSPWGADCLDIMKRRFGSGPAMGMKYWAKLLGIKPLVEETDGSQVYKFYKSGENDKILRYVESDVDLSQQLFSWGSGMFWM